MAVCRRWSRLFGATAATESLTGQKECEVFAYCGPTSLGPLLMFCQDVMQGCPAEPVDPGAWRFDFGLSGMSSSIRSKRLRRVRSLRDSKCRPTKVVERILLVWARTRNGSPLTWNAISSIVPTASSRGSWSWARQPAKLKSRSVAQQVDSSGKIEISAVPAHARRGEERFSLITFWPSFENSADTDAAILRRIDKPASTAFIGMRRRKS